jgi:endonuclease YncB( thermonuclease family)
MPLPPRRGRSAIIPPLKIAAGLVLLVAILAYGTARHAPRWEERAAAIAVPPAPAGGTDEMAERATARPIGPGLRPSPEKLLPVDHSSFGRAAKPPPDPASVDVEAETVDDSAPRPTLLPRPVVVNGGSFRVGSGTVRLTGIEPPTERCGAALWPCGARARTALRALVRSRSITCTVPGDFQAKEETLESACSLGSTDIGHWLVAHGWARAKAGGPYVEAEEKARTAQVGLWADRDPSGPGAPMPPAAPPAPPQ